MNTPLNRNDEIWESGETTKIINRKYRHAMQLIFFAVVLLAGVSLHAICPFGGVVSLYQFLDTGTLVNKVHESSLVLMGLVFILAIAFGALFCGWICPLGTLQEWIGKLGKKLFGKKYNRLMPEKIDGVLRYARYLVLLWLVYATVVAGSLVFADYCPYYALFNITTVSLMGAGATILGITALLSLLMERPWCKYACPYGALLGIFNVVRVFKLRRNSDTCISCGLCDRQCPMNIEVSGKETVHNHQCISCLECTSEDACPVPKTVGFTLPGKTGMYLRGWLIVLTTIVVIWGGVTFAQSLGVWNTKGASGRGGGEPARFTSGEYLGTYNPADIRGSHTLGITSEYFNIPLEHLAQAFGVPPSMAYNLRHGDLEAVVYPELEEMGTEIGNGSVKLFVAFYTGLPYEVDEPTFLFKEAVEILKIHGSLNEVQLEYVLEHMIDLDELNMKGVFDNLDNTTDSHSNEEIKGSTTFGEIVSWGLTSEEIETVLGRPMPDSSIKVKDFCEANELSFGHVKNDLLEMLRQ